MVIALRPPVGGFLRPFGCGWFIREFLLGHGPYGSPRINPRTGACQADIFKFYKRAILLQFAEDIAVREEEVSAAREKRRISPKNIEDRTGYYLEHIPYKLTSCRFHSFVVYFSNLQRLGWVETTGREEPSMFQEHHPSGPPRRYFRLTAAGRAASDAEWSNPLFTLYAERWGGVESARQYLRDLRRRHKYSKVGKRGRPTKAKPS